MVLCNFLVPPVCNLKEGKDDRKKLLLTNVETKIKNIDVDPLLNLLASILLILMKKKVPNEVPMS